MDQAFSHPASWNPTDEGPPSREPPRDLSQVDRDLKAMSAHTALSILLIADLLDRDRFDACDASDDPSGEWLGDLLGD